MELHKLTIATARQKLDKQEITAVELTKACLQQIKKQNLEIHACLEVVEDLALVEAEQADRRLQAGEKSPLLGIPYLVKDNILTKGVRTTAGSKILENYLAPFDATVVQRLRSAGAILLGKTNLDEFAHGVSTEYSAFGPTKNPWNIEYVPGGSSGGSAAAVISNMCLFALGTDTGGSVRHPASFCGVVGLKPSYGLCSRFGLIAMTSSTDVPGILAKTAEDASLVLDIMAGPDEKDGTTVSQELEERIDKENLQGITIGLPQEYFIPGLADEVRNKIELAIKEFEKLGAKIKEVSLPHTKYGVSVYSIITPSEISSNLARFDGIRYGLGKEKVKDLHDYYLQTRGQGFGSEVKRRIMLGTYALSAGYYDAYYLQAQKVRTKIIQDFEKVFQEVDFLLTPTTPTTAFKLGEQIKDPLKMYLEDVFLDPSSLAGLSAVSIPCGLEKGLPVGLQIIGPRFADQKILSLANLYQEKNNFNSYV